MRKRLSTIFTLPTIALIASVSSAADPTGFDQQALPFFKTYCLRCHDGTRQKGDFRLDVLSRDFDKQSVAQRWGEVLFRMNAGEMPPKKELQPKAEELGKIAEWVSTRIKEGEAARMAKRGPVAHYRLSREEYGHAIYDLLGIRFDVKSPGVFNEDPRWHGFDRIGAMLSLSPSHVDRYLKVAEMAVERAFPDQPPNPVKGRHDAISLMGQESERQRLQEQGIAGVVRVPWWPGYEGRDHLHFGNAGLPVKVRIQLSGLATKGGRTPHLTVWDLNQKKSIYDDDILAPEAKPIVVEFVSTSGDVAILNEVTGKLPDSHTRNVLNQQSGHFIDTKHPSDLNPTGYKLIDDEGNAIYPLLLVDWVEWESVAPSEVERKKRQNLLPADAGDPVEIRRCLERLATRAWRRPVTDAEIDRYVKIKERELAAGESARTAYRAAMVGVLASKNFYYLEEGSATQRRDKVNDWELASRLSFFLWSSLPDDALHAAAATGTLGKPEILQAQLERMFGDEKIGRFTEDFPRQWLQLHRVGMFPPDPGLYPDYDKWLEKSMALETTLFFSEVFSKNLSLSEFLISDWTMVNPRLARHYQLEPPSQSGFQRVSLRPKDHRGGLLTQGSVLMLTSDGTRHRPVHRGVWVSEAIFGRTPPPPPPNVEPLPPTPNDQPKATVRMQIEAHATHVVCASCHRKIDPLGFAFENYDAIGRWRSDERVAVGRGANPAANARGALPDGREFAGPDDFKRLLAADRDRFAEAFVEQMATYALRRVMTIDDAASIKAIAKTGKDDGYKLRTLIEKLVLSELFQKR